MTSPTPETMAVWVSLMSTSRRLLDAVETALKQAQLPSLDWYDVLLEVEKAGQSGIRPFELKQRLLLPQYQTSRLLDRIEKAGLVERSTCDDDGRGQIITITTRGAEIRQTMWPVYAGVLTRSIQPHFTPAEADTMARWLRRITQAAP